MKPGLLAVLAIAVGCSLAGVLAVRQGLSHRQTLEPTLRDAPIVGTDNQPASNRSGENVHVVEVRLVPEVGVTADARDMTHRKVPAGMRLISVDVVPFNVESLRPGDLVDLLVTTRELLEEDEVRTRTRTLVEFLEVFAIEEQTAGSGDVPRERVVHLLATREEVDRIRGAERDGAFCVVGRQPTDASGI